jgi:hypothetical protein
MGLEPTIPVFEWEKTDYVLNRAATVIDKFVVNEKEIQWLQSAGELYRPSERPPLVGEVSANFCG